MIHSIPAVVLDLSATGIGIVRSLSEKDINVHAFDIKGKYEIGKTRHATCGICPHPVHEELELLKFLLELGNNFNEKAVLYAGSDDYVQFISKYREDLRRCYLFLLPSPSIVEAVLDKRLTYELAVKHEVPCPKVFELENEHQLEDVVQDITFPCILKPTNSSAFRSRIPNELYKKAIVVNEASELHEKYLFYRQFGELMIQEIIEGEESRIYSVKTFFDENMNLIGIYMNQKIHQFPPVFGSSAMVLSIRDEEVIRKAFDFLLKLNFKGLSITEFKRDPRDGELKFIEINSRIGLTQRLSTACGVDLAYLYYLSLTNQNPKPVLTQREGIKWVYLVRDFISYRHKRKNGEMTFIDWMKGLSGKRVEALFAWDDPLPFIRSFYSHLRNLWKNR
ncbi:carbamoyl-phosphate synthase [Sporosarcina highlanderae]|uniref:Carbamoyl-phosphate synthase n=1 Tax=Sporosarcina highlanderae TaxID=3035916 RepID=A0ABT8JW42_9BACL|nr:carbamoyl-phosphate synthase [Sporosarcina highlanderae]MDN4609013.1 carbamoyl-phosphate synthase [Sporosarcina highlanderae]